MAVYDDDFRGIFIEWKRAYNELITAHSQIGDDLISSLRKIDRNARVVMQFRDQFSEDLLKKFSDWLKIATEFRDNYKISFQHLNGRNSFKMALQNAEASIDSLFSEMMPQISDLINITEQSVKQREIAEVHAKAKIDAAEIASLSEELKTTVDLFKEEYLPMIKRLNLADYREDFSSIAVADKKASKGWLVATVGAILVTIVTVCFFFSNSISYTAINYALENKASSTFPWSMKSLFYLEVLKAVFYRLFFVSIGVYLIKICLNKYKSAQHNYTVNIHKANSLKAALTFMDKISDTKIQDKIIAQASNSIFSHQPTGYNEKNPENIGFGEKVVEKLIEKVA